MRDTPLRQLFFLGTTVASVFLLSACSTTAPRITRRLPPFEPPIAKADIQTVRTTAYTHTESDHLAYGNRNALGGELRAATVPSSRADMFPRIVPLAANAATAYQFGAATRSTADDEDEPKPVRKATAVKSKKDSKVAKHSAAPKKTAKPSDDDDDVPVRKATAAKPSAAKVLKAKPVDDDDQPIAKAKAVESKPASAAKKEKVKRAVAVNEKTKGREAKAPKGARRAIAVKKPKPPVIGSAAADWARWPVGTTFRLLSTGQIYRVDDTGWALAGRNTIDLYMATTRDMNTWGTRAEKIEVLHWGDPEESARLLASRQDYKHTRRMLLELSGRYDEAAQLE